MQKISTALVLAIGVGLLCCQGAGAVPADASAIENAAAANSTVEHTQFFMARTRHGFVKCYREFIIGPYGCHHWYYW